jgi:predicted hotdog family 3-hydroxylacyl-ACP dehydratase
MALNRRWIAAHIPHQGDMCLLDEVLDWNPSEIRCRTGSHRLATNPLRTGAQLHALCGIEYAAQAVAIHGALTASEIGHIPSLGYLASVRNVDLRISRLDDVASDLLVSAIRLGGGSTALMYEFSVSSEERVLVTGRGTIFLGTLPRRYDEARTPC